MLGMKLGMFPPDPGVRDSTTASAAGDHSSAAHI